MPTPSLLAAFRRMLGDKCGTYAITAAVMAPPLFGAVGAAVDYSIMTRVRSKLQEAVDSATLAAGQDFIQSGGTRSLDTLARNHFKANYVDRGSGGVPTFTLSLGPSGDVNRSGESTGMALRGHAVVDYNLALGDFLGVTNSRLDAAATVNVSSATLEVAFVIDASGSMTQADAFQKSTKATRDMVHDLKQYALALRNATGIDSAYVKYALVPFAWTVNVGSDKAGADWLDPYGWAPHHHTNLDWTQGHAGAKATATGWKKGSDWLTRDTVRDAIGDDWAGCVEARAWPHFRDDTPPSLLDPTTLFVPSLAPDEPDLLGGSEAAYGNSYLVDAIVSKTATIALNGSNTGNLAKQLGRLPWTSKYNTAAAERNYDKAGKGPDRNCFRFPILALNDHFGDTNSNIANLNVTFSATHAAGTGIDDGSTNIQQGLVWGWHTLSSTPPFAEGRPETDRNNKKIVVLVSDGVNSYGSATVPTGSDYAAFGFLSENRLDAGLVSPVGMTVRAKMDAQTLATCAAMRAAGIELFVVGYGVTAGSQADGMLGACAGGSRAQRYYYRVVEEDIAAAMTTIRTLVADMRLAS